MMSATCTLTQKNDRVSKLYTFQSKTLVDRQKQIKFALRHMQMVRTSAEGIATQWVQAMTFPILGGHTGESLNEIIGRVLDEIFDLLLALPFPMVDLLHHMYISVRVVIPTFTENRDYDTYRNVHVM